MISLVNGLSIGQKAKLARTFTTEDVINCTRLTQEFNPLYENENTSWKPHFDNPIVPGVLTDGLITQVITHKLPGGCCILLQKELIYSHPVHIGDTITAELEIIDINEKRNWVTQRVSCFNQDTQEVIRGQVVNLILQSSDGDLDDR